MRAHQVSCLCLELVEEELKKAAALLSAAKNVVVLTGAGISKESGIPTFREAQTGLWSKYEPEKLATPEGFANDPALVWKWYNWRRALVASVVPNAGHFALTELERRMPNFVLLTQNVDGLHLVAGSKNVVELHGSIRKFKCFEQSHEASNIPADLDYPPSCELCGSLIRPDIVWFGEALDQKDLDRAFSACLSADVFIVVGTSGLVQPAASFPFTAHSKGAKVIECNLEPTPITRIADVFLAGPSGETLPLLLQ